MINKLEVCVEWQENGESKVFRQSFNLPAPIDLPYVRWCDDEKNPKSAILVWQHSTFTDEERQELIREGKIGTAKL